MPHANEGEMDASSRAGEPPRIAVVGSLMMDVVVRASRAPLAGESLPGHNIQFFPGGKGANQAVAAARLGARVALIGAVGSDDFGDRLIASVESEGVDCQGVIRRRRHATGVAVPLVYDDGSNSIITMPGANLALSAADIEAFGAIISHADALLVQFESSLKAVAASLLTAQNAGVPVFLNAAPVDLGGSHLVSGATHVIVNEVEAAALVPAAGGEHLMEVRQLVPAGGTALVTLGQEGSLLATADGTQVIKPFSVRALDTVGAGDAFTAAYAVAILERRPPTEAARFASAAGALAVTQAGARSALPTHQAVLELLGEGGSAPVRNLSPGSDV